MITIALVVVMWYGIGQTIIIVSNLKNKQMKQVYTVLIGVAFVFAMGLIYFFI